MLRTNCILAVTQLAQLTYMINTFKCALYVRNSEHIHCLHTEMAEGANGANKGNSADRSNGVYMHLNAACAPARLCSDYNSQSKAERLDSLLRYPLLNYIFTLQTVVCWSLSI